MLMKVVINAWHLITWSSSFELKYPPLLTVVRPAPLENDDDDPLYEGAGALYEGAGAGAPYDWVGAPYPAEGAL